MIDAIAAPISVSPGVATFAASEATLTIAPDRSARASPAGRRASCAAAAARSRSIEAARFQSGCRAAGEEAGSDRCCKPARRSFPGFRARVFPLAGSPSGSPRRLERRSGRRREPVAHRFASSGAAASTPPEQRDASPQRAKWIAVSRPTPAVPPRRTTPQSAIGFVLMASFPHHERWIDPSSPLRGHQGLYCGRARSFAPRFLRPPLSTPG